VTVSIAGKAAAKLVKIYIENNTEAPAELDAAYYTQPLPGSGAEQGRMTTVTRRGEYALAVNAWSPVRGCACLLPPEGGYRLVTDRADFFAGRWGGTQAPSGPAPCCAAVVHRRLAPGGSVQLDFALAWAASPQALDETCRIIRGSGQLRAPCLKEEDGAVTGGSGVVISTPDKALDAFFNGLLTHQIISSRLRGRTGFYQCGGAWGFRDQLQDCCAAAALFPLFARAHIIRAAAHQFPEGDVMHWWHQLPPRDGGSRGVRTRISDDPLWLVYAACEYYEQTGDGAIFDIPVPYIDAPALGADEADRYFTPSRSRLTEPLLGHCVRALRRVSGAAGPHGLPLFGTGDWNDGMNRVGAGGKGESVWLAMFLALVSERFAGVLRALGRDSGADACLNDALEMKKLVDRFCWDGAWYLRGFYDDGAPLGGAGARQCEIDLLPQCFATLAGMPDEGRRRAAMDSALAKLCDPDTGLIKLLRPPFDIGGRDAGYIGAYPPGVRENGGQYTHAAVWAAAALLEQGRADEGLRLLDWMNPALRTKDRGRAEIYRLEPYALAGDISASPARAGRGGWSLYTGAAGWYYSTVLGRLLGIRLCPQGIRLRPSLPESWQGFGAQIDLRGTHAQLTVRRGADKGLRVDGREAPLIALDGGRHSAELIL
jgi:cyclic beta-1,2-glucan synthetase